eukprot:gene14852-biopygen8136
MRPTRWTVTQRTHPQPFLPLSPEALDAIRTASSSSSQQWWRRQLIGCSGCCAAGVERRAVHCSLGPSFLRVARCVVCHTRVDLSHQRATAPAAAGGARLHTTAQGTCPPPNGHAASICVTGVRRFRRVLPCDTRWRGIWVLDTKAGADRTPDRTINCKEAGAGRV